MASFFERLKEKFSAKEELNEEHVIVFQTRLII